VVVLEGRDRLGGRVHSLRSDDVTVELGAAVLMGVQGGNPLAALCRKHGLRMHKLSHECPLHDIDGSLLTADTDSVAETLFNTMLDAAASACHSEVGAMSMGYMTIG